MVYTSIFHTRSRAPPEHFTQRTCALLIVALPGPGLFANNAVVCKYSWKQCDRDLTFWDSSGSVSFFGGGGGARGRRTEEDGCTEAADRAT